MNIVRSQHHMTTRGPHPEPSPSSSANPYTDVSVPGMLQDMVLESADVEQFLTNLAKLAAGRFSSPDAEVLAAVTLLRPRTEVTVASSNDQAQKMDEIQYAFDDGPCLRAAREGTVHAVVQEAHHNVRCDGDSISNLVFSAV
jgi:hypothetical protein